MSSEVGRRAFSNMLTLNEDALLWATLRTAIGQPCVLEVPEPFQELDEVECGRLRELVTDLMPRDTAFLNLWDWDLHFEEELQQDWYEQAAFGSGDVDEWLVEALVDFYLDAVARYDIDTGVDADYDLRSDLEEDANQFIRSWRLHVRSTFLPEWVRFRESDGNMT